MIELYIDGQLCDLSGSETIGIDYAMFSIEDIAKRKGSRSYNFDLPKTTNNQRIFEVSEEVTNLSRKPYRKMSALLYSDGVDLQIRFAELTASGEKYSINLYGSNASFFDLIKNKKLRDLDLSAQNHYWTFANVVTGLTNTYEAGDFYCYPIIDYGVDDGAMNNTLRKANPTFLPPALFVDAVLVKMFSEAGYALVNTMNDVTDYSNERPIIPTVSTYVGNKYNAVFNIAADAPSRINRYGNVSIISINSIVSYDGDYWTLPYPSTYTYQSNVSSGNGLYFQDNITCGFRFTFSVENLNAGPVLLQIWGTDGASGPQHVRLIATQTVQTGTNTYTFEGFVDQSNQAFGNQRTFLLFPLSNPQVTIKAAGSTVEVFDASDQDLLRYGNYIQLHALLPDIKQSDFLKQYMQMFGLIPIVNEITKTVTLQRFDYIADRGRALDFSDKIDLSSEQVVTYLVDEYGQKNKFTWIQDEDELQPLGTNGEIIIDNENLELEKTIVELDFASTYSLPKLIDLPVCKIGIFEGGEIVNEKEPRMLLHNFVTLAGSPVVLLELNDGASTASTAFIALPRFIDTAYTYNLGFGNALLALFYQAITAVLTDYKKVSLLLRLNAADINQLDFTRPIYIKHFNAYFYINLIRGYNPDSVESTEVELIKLF